MPLLMAAQSDEIATKAVMVGAGGHAQMLFAVCQEYAEAELPIVGWVTSDDDATEVLGLPVWKESLETLEHLKADGVTHFVFGMGMVSPKTVRWRVYQQWVNAGFEPVTVVHPSAIVAQTAQLGLGTYVGAQAVVQPYAVVGDAVIINTAAVVEHHNSVGDNVHVACNATLCGDVVIGDHTMIGAGAVVVQGVTVPDHTMVKAQQLVTASTVFEQPVGV